MYSTLNSVSRYGYILFNLYTPDTVHSELVKLCTKKIAVVHYTRAVSSIVICKGWRTNKMILYSILVDNTVLGYSYTDCSS